MSELKKDVYEPIRVINAWGLGFELGNVVKNIAAVNEDNELEELKKAQYYLEARINHIETERKRESWRKNKKNARKKVVPAKPAVKKRPARKPAQAPAATPQSGTE